jgi:hypothetical protein
MCGSSQNDEPELREIAELIEEFEQNIAHNATLGCYLGAGTIFRVLLIAIFN